MNNQWYCQGSCKFTVVVVGSPCADNIIRAMLKTSSSTTAMVRLGTLSGPCDVARTLEVRPRAMTCDVTAAMKVARRVIDPQTHA